MINALKQSPRWLLAAAIVLSLASCGPSLSGRYEGQGNLRTMMSFDFKDGDTVRIETMGQIVEAAYKLEGKEIRITANNMTQIYVLEDDGCFKAGPLGRMCPAGKAS